MKSSHVRSLGGWNIYGLTLVKCRNMNAVCRALPFESDYRAPERLSALPCGEFTMEDT